MYSMSILTCTISLLVSLVLPILFIILYGLKHRRQGLASAWILGALGFVVTQLFIRIPLLQLWGGLPGAQDWAIRHYVLYVLALAFTAGLFEFAGRFAAAKIMDRKALTYRRSLAAGLGHGGIEAILLVGMTCINNLSMLMMLQTGSFDAMVAQTAAAGVDTAPLLAAQEALSSTHAGLFLLGGYERLATMAAHAAMSMLVCWGVHTGKPLKPFLWCLGIHTFIDGAAGLFMVMATPELGLISQTTSYFIIYPILTAVAVLSLFIIRSIHRRWNAELEVTHVEAN